MKRRNLLTSTGLLPELITIILKYARGFKGKQIDFVQCDQEIAYKHIHDGNIFLLLEDGSVWKMSIAEISKVAEYTKICILPPFRNGYIDIHDGGCWVIVDTTGKHLWVHRTEHHLDGGPITYVSLVDGKSFNLANYYYPTFNPCTIKDGLVFRDIASQINYYQNSDAPCIILTENCTKMTVYKNDILWIDNNCNLWMFDGKESRITQTDIKTMIKDDWTIWLQLNDYRWIDWVNNISVSSMYCPKSVANGDFLRSYFNTVIRNTTQKVYPYGIQHGYVCCIENILLLPSGEVFARLKNAQFFCDDRQIIMNQGIEENSYFLGFTISNTQKATYLLLCYNNKLILLK